MTDDEFSTAHPLYRRSVRLEIELPGGNVSLNVEDPTQPEYDAILNALMQVQGMKS